jgi:hypothetical protein
MPMTQVKKLYKKGGKTKAKKKAKKYAGGGEVGVSMPESVKGLGPKRNATLSRTIDRDALANKEPGGASRDYKSGPGSMANFEERANQAPKSNIKPKKDPGKMKDGGKVKGYRAGGMTRGCGAATKGRNHSNKMG